MFACACEIFQMFVGLPEAELAAGPIRPSVRDFQEQANDCLCFVGFLRRTTPAQRPLKTVHRFRETPGVGHQAAQFRPGVGAFRIDLSGAPVGCFRAHPIAGIAEAAAFLHHFASGRFPAPATRLRRNFLRRKHH